VLLHWWDDGDGGQQSVIGVFSNLQSATDAKVENDKQLPAIALGRLREGFEIEEKTLDQVTISPLQFYKPVTK
jgi:hypothetical protein